MSCVNAGETKSNAKERGTTHRLFRIIYQMNCIRPDWPNTQLFDKPFRILRISSILRRGWQKIDSDMHRPPQQ